MAEETQNPVLGVEQPRPPQETASSFTRTYPSSSSPTLADSSSSSSTSLSSSQEVEQVGQHLEDGNYFYGGDENHLFYKFYGHNSEGLPVSMKYALIYDPLPRGFRRIETKVEQIGGRTWKSEKKQRKKQEKLAKKQQKQAKKEEVIHRHMMRKEEKERRKAEFRQKVFQEVLRREWLKFYIHQHQLQKKEERTQKKQEKKQRKLNELELKHKRYHEQLPAWMFEQGGGGEDKEGDQYLQDRNQQQQRVSVQYSPEAWQRYQNSYMQNQRLWSVPTPLPEEKETPEIKLQRRPTTATPSASTTTEGERALFAKTDQERRNLKTVKEFMKIAYSLKKAQLKKDVLERLLTPDAQFISPGTLPEVRTCREYVDAHIVIMKSLPDLRICTFDFECQEGNKVVLRYTASGTHRGEPYRSTSNKDLAPLPPTFKNALWSASALFELEEGKIKKFIKEWSKETMYSQLGWPLEDCVPPENVADQLREVAGIKKVIELIGEKLKEKEEEKMGKEKKRKGKESEETKEQEKETEIEEKTSEISELPSSSSDKKITSSRLQDSSPTSLNASAPTR